MSKPIDHTKLERDRLVAELVSAIWRGDHAGIDTACNALRDLAKTEAGILNSREAIQPQLRRALSDDDYLQGDYDMIGTRQSHEWGE